MHVFFWMCKPYLGDETQKVVYLGLTVFLRNCLILSAILSRLNCSASVLPPSVNAFLNSG